MWDRLNEGKEFYKHEASLILNHVIGLTTDMELFARSPTVFHIMLLLNRDMRREHLAMETLPSNSSLLKKCEEAQKRIRVRCAGMLEMNDVAIEPSETSDALKRANASQGGTGDWLPKLKKYYYTHLRFIHRTARDFLLCTATGRETLSYQPCSEAEAHTIALQGEVVARITGIIEPMLSWVDGFLQDVYFLDLGVHKVPLLKAMDHACTLYFSRTDLGNNSTKWVIRAKCSEEEPHSLPLFALDFVGLAIAYGHLDYLISEADPRQLDMAYLDYLTLILSFSDPLRLYGAFSQNPQLHTLASEWLVTLLELGGKSLKQSLREFIWQPPTTAPVPQYPLQVSTTEEARKSTSRSNYMIQNDPQDDDYHRYVLWFKMSPIFVLQHIQRLGGQTLSDLDHLNPSTTALPHWEPVCICRPDIDIAAVLTPEDSMALVESYEAMEAMWWNLPDQERFGAWKSPECYQKVHEIFQRSKKVDMCQYLLAKGYIKHPDNPEVFREAPPMFRESARQGFEEVAEPEVLDVGAPGTENDGRVSEVVDESESAIKPLEKRMTDLSIYYDAQEDLPGEVA
ncbi:hypothetical protein PV11_01649 [Exophiala sideris]|uniref:DUF7791 domain-containing protein n=1 Tax=Exophiala sideris TaxID=1016849 RepID=A0A0D1XDM4_9EURO|nr:hypothetical protein PV11_01649 [Exophiala sideris]